MVSDICAFMAGTRARSQNVRGACQRTGRRQREHPRKWGGMQSTQTQPRGRQSARTEWHIVFVSESGPVDQPGLNRCIEPSLEPELTGSSADCILNPSSAYPASCKPRRYGSRIFISSAISLAVFPASSRASSFAPATTRRSMHGRDALMVAQ